MQYGGRELVGVALSRGLYEAGGEFERLLTECPEDIIEMALSVYGLAMIYTNGSDPRTFIGCYVRPEYRKQGHGSELINQLGGKQNHSWATSK